MNRNYYLFVHMTKVANNRELGGPDRAIKGHFCNKSCVSTKKKGRLLNVLPVRAGGRNILCVKHSDQKFTQKRTLPS